MSYLQRKRMCSFQRILFDRLKSPLRYKWHVVHVRVLITQKPSQALFWLTVGFGVLPSGLNVELDLKPWLTVWPHARIRVYNICGMRRQLRQNTFAKIVFYCFQIWRFRWHFSWLFALALRAFVPPDPHADTSSDSFMRTLSSALFVADNSMLMRFVI